MVIVLADSPAWGIGHRSFTRPGACTRTSSSTSSSTGGVGVFALRQFFFRHAHVSDALDEGDAILDQLCFDDGSGIRILLAQHLLAPQEHGDFGSETLEGL